MSGIARPRAHTSADRRALSVHNLPECKKPITVGWQFSIVVVLPPTPSSWTYVLDQHRVSTHTTAAQLGTGHLQQLVPVLPANTVAVLDRGYNSTWLWCQCSGLPIKGPLVCPHATNAERDPRVSWLVWIGDKPADLVQIAPG